MISESMATNAPHTVPRNENHSVSTVMFDVISATAPPAIPARVFNL